MWVRVHSLHMCNQENVHLTASVCMIVQSSWKITLREIDGGKENEKARDTVKVHTSMNQHRNNRVKIYAHKIYTEQLVLAARCLLHGMHIIFGF